jgi:sec-independent protein translocase protein TatA
MFATNIVSPAHLVLVLLVIVFLFGTKKLPELGRGLGSAMREFRGGVSGSGTAPGPDEALVPPTPDPQTGDRPVRTTR